MNIFQIEERIKEKPTSPLCVRLASMYLTRGRIEEAMKICFDSIERFPKYATNYIVLGRCYAALQVYEPAILCLEKSLSLNQASILPRNLLSNWRQLLLSKSEESGHGSFDRQHVSDSAKFLLDLFNKFDTIHTPPVFREALLEEVKTDIHHTTKRMIQEVPSLEPVSQGILAEEIKDDINPTIEIELPPIDHTTDKIIQETNPPESIPLGILPEEIKDDINPTEEIELPPIDHTTDQIIQETNPPESIPLGILPEEIKDDPQPIEEMESHLIYKPPTIISSTLAEIYIEQGEYEEAINIYKTLIKRKPNQKRLFEDKIKILEKNIKAKHDK